MRRVDSELLAIAARINKKLGEGTIVLGSEISKEEIGRVTSGSLSLDIALGGGWPLNRWSEIIGYESAGKTLIALKTIAANQARDKSWTTVWIDAEQCWDKRWVRQLGVDDSRVIVVNDNGTETAYQATIDYLMTRKIDCIVVDSLPALVPEREDDNMVGEMAPGLGALLTGQFFRKQQPAMKRSLVKDERPVLGLMINQWRDRIGVMYGDPRTTPGGRGKNFYYAIRLEVKRDDWIEESDLRIGQTIKASCIKNKTAPPQRIAVFDFYFADTEDGKFRAGEYDRQKEIVASALMHKLIARSGAYYSIGERKWQGKETLLAALRDEPALLAELEGEVRQVVFPRERAVKRTVRPKK
jgi:recombination protein RecA